MFQSNLGRYITHKHNGLSNTDKHITNTGFVNGDCIICMSCISPKELSRILTPELVAGQRLICVACEVMIVFGCVVYFKVTIILRFERVNRDIALLN